MDDVSTVLERRPEPATTGSPVAPRRVTVCMATMRRPGVVDTLAALDRLVLPADIELAGVVVADNDEAPSSRERVLEAARGMRTPVRYVHAPYRNISIARNACLEACETEWLAFMDDDETPAPDWLAKLFERRDGEDLDLVFGPAIAVYPDDTPAWIRSKDYHTSRPVREAGQVQTGHAGNALIRVGHPDVRDERFLLERGRTGGEDTEFFFRLWRKGLRLGIANDAVVYEPVEPKRLSFDWLAKRRFRSGQTYGRHAAEGQGTAARAKLFVAAAIKAAVCTCAAAAQALNPTERNFWALRGRFHAGVCAAAFRVKEAELY